MVIQPKQSLNNMANYSQEYGYLVTAVGDC